MTMSNTVKKYKYVIELDFTTFDDVEFTDDINTIEYELFQELSVELSRLVQKYDSLVGFRQDLEHTTLSRGETV